MDSNETIDQNFTVRKTGPNRWLVLGLALVVLSYLVGYRMGEKGYTFEPKEFKVVNKSEQPKTVDYKLLWDAIDVLNEKYIDHPVSPQKLLYGSIKGAVESTGDPYTVFFEPKQFDDFKTELAGSFDGIGAEIGKRNGSIVIIAPIEGMPAKAAGLMAKDVIIQVNGESTQDWTVEQTVSKIRGPKGTQVKLMIYREGKDKPFEVSITRQTIEVKSVKWEFKDVKTSSGQTKKVVVVTMSKFGDDTVDLFDKAVKDIQKQHADAIVLDLRNNPGGYLDSSVRIASEWVSLGTLVVKEEKSTGNSKDYKALGNNRLKDIKTTILINGGSASASEILAGALHDYKIASLIGEKSFGKGSVQEIVNLKDGSAIKVTIAKWITPNGKNLNKDGLDPDIEVKISDEDITAGKDPQMEKALEEVIK